MHKSYKNLKNKFYTNLYFETKDTLFIKSSHLGVELTWIG